MATAENAMFSVTDLSKVNDKSPHGISERQKKLRLSVNFRPVTLKQILAYIDHQDMDSELKAVLCRQVSRYPNSALQRFADNFTQMVNVAQRGLRKTYTIDSAPVVHDPDAIRPTGQYLSPDIVLPKVEPLPVVKSRKIDMSELNFDADTPFDVPNTAVESSEGIPVSLSVAVNVNNVRRDIVADESKEQEEKKLPPQPQPQPPPKPKPAVFSANLNHEDFE